MSLVMSGADGNSVWNPLLKHVCYLRGIDYRGWGLEATPFACYSFIKRQGCVFVFKPSLMSCRVTGVPVRGYSCSLQWKLVFRLKNSLPVLWASSDFKKVRQMSTRSPAPGMFNNHLQQCPDLQQNYSIPSRSRFTYPQFQTYTAWSNFRLNIRKFQRNWELVKKREWNLCM